jgi:Domain of unknown function (DUF4470)
MRNLVKTLVGLPETYKGCCNMTLNDRDFDIVARNTMLLLTAFRFDPEVATPMMLHIWYSALIPASILQSLQDKILPLIQDVCARIQSKPASSLQAKTWIYDKKSLRLVLRKEQWLCLRNFLKVPDGLSVALAQKIRKAVMLAPQRKDYLDRALYKQPPSWRMCTMKFRGDGILLPYGSSRAEFDTPNPYVK